VLAVVPEIAEQVDHHRRRMRAGIAERQAAQGAHLLFELVGDAGIERVVAAVVRARRHFIDDQAAATDEELDTHGADVAEVCGDARATVFGVAGEAARSPRRHDRDIEDALGVAGSRRSGNNARCRFVARRTTETS
jgi:phytoene/squalene synthetase